MRHFRLALPILLIFGLLSGVAVHAQVPVQAGTPQIRIGLTNPASDFNNAITYIGGWLNIQNIKFYIGKTAELLKSADDWLKSKIGINAESLISDVKNIIVDAILFAVGLVRKGLSYL